MNIGIVTTWLERGAAYVSRMYMDTLSRRHDIFIYGRGDDRHAMGDPKWDGHYVTWGKVVPGAPKYVDWKDFKKWVLKNDIEIVIFNEQHSWEIIRKALRLNIAIGAYIDYYEPQTVPFFGLYDFLLCNTKRHYSVFKWHPQAFYVPWGTDSELFKPLSVSVPKKDGITFFHSCGVSPLRKGTDILVRAFQNVKGNARLVIHSQSLFKDHPPTLSLIRQNNKIELIEKEVGAPGLYMMGDVYVYPSILEGIGLTIAEALASGLPVITTDEPPMNEFVTHDLNGKLVKVERYKQRADNYYWSESFCSEDALSRAMQFYIDNSHNIKEFQYRARKYAEEYLDWRRNSESLSKDIENVVDKHRKIDRRLVKTVAEYDRIRYYNGHNSIAIDTAIKGTRLAKHAAKKMLATLRLI